MEVVPERAPPFHLGHRPWLDGVRGVAVLLVLAFHFRFLTGGCFGVDVFFVLSGFLITTLLASEWQRRGAISLPRFYLRRLLRLFPALAALLACGYVFTAMYRPAEEPQYRREMLYAALYLSNFQSLHHLTFSSLGHTWSLAVEEQFYLIWPLVLVLLLRSRVSPRTLVWIVAAGVVASAVHRNVLFYFRPPQGPLRNPAIMRLYTGLDTRADALLMGCLAGLLATWNLLPKSLLFRRLLGVAAAASTAGLAFAFTQSCMDRNAWYYGGFTLLALAVAIIITQLLANRSGAATKILSSFPLTVLGRLSYGLYLYHIPVVEWLGLREMGWKAPGETATAVGVTFAAAVLSYYLVERPFLRLKDRLQSGTSELPANERRPRLAA
jgi:peptidoglycan/LPS O-acetylase OafA/YrhL